MHPIWMTIKHMAYNEIEFGQRYIRAISKFKPIRPLDKQITCGKFNLNRAANATCTWADGRTFINRSSKETVGLSPQTNVGTSVVYSHEFVRPFQRCSIWDGPGIASRSGYKCDLFSG